MDSKASKSTDTVAQPAELSAPVQPIPGGPAAVASDGLAAEPSAFVPPEAVDPPMDDASKQDFLWKTHQYLGEYARFSDTKAAFSGAIASTLLGALYAAKVHVPLIRTSFHEWTFVSSLTAVGGLLLLFSVALTVWAVLPRLRSSQSKGFIYWGAVAAHQKVDVLQTSFQAQSTRTLNDHLLHHVFDISTKVCVPKFRIVWFCIATLAAGAALSVAALVLQDVFPPSAKAPPCKNGTDVCPPWERDWSHADLKPGSVVTDEGSIRQRR